MIYAALKGRKKKSSVVLSSAALFIFNQRLFTSAAQKKKKKKKNPNADARRLQLLINRAQEVKVELDGGGNISRIPLWNEPQQFPTGSNFPLIVMDFKATPGTQLSFVFAVYHPFKTA